jgi:NADH-quinone oxidoreductase subunit J
MNTDILFLSVIGGVILWTIMTTRLLRAVIGLALTSVLISAMMFRLDSPIAAVFELSVCAGLISVIFFTTISFTQRLTPERYQMRKRERIMKFWFLPVACVGLVVLLLQYKVKPDFSMAKGVPGDVRDVMWNLRHLDIFGQIAILLTGVFGVAVLFKDRKEKR